MSELLKVPTRMRDGMAAMFVAATTEAPSDTDLPRIVLNYRKDIVMSGNEQDAIPRQIEGIDGAPKSTKAASLAIALAASPENIAQLMDEHDDAQLALAVAYDEGEPEVGIVPPGVNLTERCEGEELVGIVPHAGRTLKATFGVVVPQGPHKIFISADTEIAHGLSPQPPAQLMDNIAHEGDVPAPNVLPAHSTPYFSLPK